MIYVLQFVNFRTHFDELRSTLAHIGSNIGRVADVEGLALVLKIASSQWLGKGNRRGHVAGVEQQHHIQAKQVVDEG